MHYLSRKTEARLTQQVHDTAHRTHTFFLEKQFELLVVLGRRHDDGKHKVGVNDTP